MAMLDASLDGSFYYHLWDQTCYVDEFQPFFGDVNIMYHHWNEVPHRFGLFGVNQEVRPQYFVYQMLSRMGNNRLKASSDTPELRVLAGKDADAEAVLLTSFALRGNVDRLGTIHFTHLAPGRRRLQVWRIDGDRRWSTDKLELQPVESREVDVRETFTCQLTYPADSVTLLRLEGVR